MDIKPKYKWTTEETKEKIRSDRRSGARFKDLGDKYCISSTTLGYIIKGIEIPFETHGKRHMCQVTTIKQEEEIGSQYKAGELFSDLCKAFNLHKTTIRKILKEQKVQTRKHEISPDGRARISEDIKRRWRERREEMLAQTSVVQFQPGISDLEIHITTAAKKRLRKVLLAKQNYCNRCGGIKKLHIHHIKPVQDYPELAMVIDNCEVLCQRCHASEEASRVWAKRKANIDQQPTAFEAWLAELLRSVAHDLV